MPLIVRISDERRDMNGNLSLKATVTSLVGETTMSAATQRAKARSLMAAGLFSESNLDERLRNRVIVDDVESSGERFISEEFVFDITVIS